MANKSQFWIIIPVVVIILSSAFVVSNRTGLFGAGNSLSASSSTTLLSDTTQTSTSTFSSTSLSTISTSTQIIITNPLPVTVDSIPLPNVNLSLHLSLSATVLLPKEAFNVTLSIYNTLDSYNYINASDNWAMFSIFLYSWPCAYYVHYAIFQGYYVRANLSSGTPLPLVPPGYGPTCFYFNNGNLRFDPLSNNATGFDGAGFVTLDTGWPTFGYFPYTTQILTNGSDHYNVLYFSQGEYTVVAGDEWGDLAIAYFMVV